MRLLFNPVLLLASAGIASIFGLAIWYAFLRPAPELSGTGLITNKTFQPARTIKRYQAGARRESWSQDTIAIPDSFFFDIRVEGLPAPLHFSMPAVEAAKYTVGQNVLLRYVDRGIPMLRPRLQVTEMAPANPRAVP
jgi:hypothetical protein